MSLRELNSLTFEEAMELFSKEVTKAKEVQTATPLTLEELSRLSFDELDTYLADPANTYQKYALFLKVIEDEDYTFFELLDNRIGILRELKERVDSTDNYLHTYLNRLTDNYAAIALLLEGNRTNIEAVATILSEDSF